MAEAAGLGQRLEKLDPPLVDGMRDRQGMLGALAVVVGIFATSGNGLEQVRRDDAADVRVGLRRARHAGGVASRAGTGSGALDRA